MIKFIVNKWDISQIRREEFASKSLKEGEVSLKIEKAGFTSNKWKAMTLGICSLYIGRK